MIKQNRAKLYLTILVFLATSLSFVRVVSPPSVDAGAECQPCDQADYCFIHVENNCQGDAFWSCVNDWCDFDPQCLNHVNAYCGFGYGICMVSAGC
jgi:hypothetical protein